MVGNLVGSYTTPTSFYASATGRLERFRVGQCYYLGTDCGVAMHTYDASGNLEFIRRDSVGGGGGSTGRTDRYAYYGPTGRLRATDSRMSYMDSNPYQIEGTFEEYRYDALGRRVVARSRAYCAALYYVAQCGYTRPRPGTIRRTVWDGTQELHEITMPGDEAIDAGTLENDSAAVSPPSWPSPITTKLGRTMYVHGLKVDKPEALIRTGYLAPFWHYNDTLRSNEL